MTNKKTSKKALLSSMLSFALCLVMLIGTTFAWFTDSVTSGRNVIQSGNLDVELYYSVLDDAGEWTEYKKVTDTTDVFGYDLWEPGYTKVAKFKVANEGSLALKYQLSADVYKETIGRTKDGAEIKLSDYLMYGVTGDLDALTDRTTASALATTSFKSFEIKASTLAKGTNAEVGMVITMPTTVGNEANHDGTNVPSIEFGINLVATQTEAEADSFGVDYDKDATYPVVVSANKKNNEGAELVAGEVKVDVPATAEAGKYNLVVSNKQVNTDDSGKTTVAYDIELQLDGEKVEATSTQYEVSIYVGKNLDIVAVTHKGAAVSAWDYDPTVGVVVFTTDSFSPFAVEYKEADESSVFVPTESEITKEELVEMEAVAVDENGNKYKTLTEAVKSNASKLYFKPGVDLGTITHLDVDHDLVIYGNGAYISAGERDFAIDTYKLLDKDITVTVYNLHGVAFWGQRNTSYTVTLNLYNCNDISRIYLNGTTGINNVNMYNCVADKATLIGDTAVYSNANGKLVIDSCTFKNIGCPINLNHKVAGEQEVVVTNNTFVDCSTEGTAAYYAPIRLYNSVVNANQTLYAMGNIFTYSEGKAPINAANILLNKKHDGKDASGSISATIPMNESYYKDGKDVSVAFGLSNVAELKAFAVQVNQGNSFKGFTVKLLDNIDLGNEEWTPIGNSTYKFQGTFDGNRKTISNLKISGNKSDVGLFGFTTDGEIKNLIVENANVSGYLNVGVVAGTPYTSKYTNITVKGHVEVNGFAYVGGIGGKNAYANWDNIKVEVDSTSYVKAYSIDNGSAYRTYVGGVIGFMGEGGHKVSNVTSNIDVFGSTCDIGGIAGIAHYDNIFENITCTGNVAVTDAAEAGDAEEMGGIAGVWHNKNGTKVTFINCKFAGTLKSNITDGVDLSDNLITGAKYSATGTGELVIK